jgi:uncharacterized protein (DUF305 family)
MRDLAPFTLLAALAFAVGLAGDAQPAGAQAPMPGHAGTGHAASAASLPSAARTAASDHQEMMDAMARMNRDMMAPNVITGDPDRDFVAMMTPHHQGAIDMARIYLRTGRDPQIRRLAQKIIADQEREMGEMRAWQARHPVPSPAR